MTEDSKKQDQLLETTDCLEAIGTLKSNKNFFFSVCLFCLLLLQACFWLTFTGHVNIGTDEPTAPDSLSTVKLTMLASHAKPEPVAITEPVSANSVEPNTQKSEPNAVWHKYVGQLSHSKINFSHIAWTVRICNYLLIICSTVFSMTLLFGLMISLVGRLGGISHVTKAFFISLLMIVVLVPWQILFKNVGIGAIFTPAELLANIKAYSDSDIISKSIMFLRYIGLAAVVFLLLIWAQLKSMRWSKNTLKRLGIVG